MTTKKEIGVSDNRELILKKVRDDERNLMWLSKKTGIPYGTLYYCCVRKQFLMSNENLEKVNKILNTSFKNK